MFLKGGSSGTMVNIVILREKKNETNMQKAVLDPRKALSAAAQVNGNGRARLHSPFWLWIGRCLPTGLLVCFAKRYFALVLLCCLDRIQLASVKKNQTAVRYSIVKERKQRRKKERKKVPTGATRYGMFPRSFALASLALARGMDEESPAVCRSVRHKTRNTASQK